ncbi:MAG: hypothetical protein A7315_11265 [Candidatus Altiarchaeales archaeon WOR_SM1_79]|nr:MAG: hypothetical protein A7315_11265 [Candidatus Altiarchaeales archaeon WOR_SM1_79]
MLQRNKLSKINNAIKKKEQGLEHIKNEKEKQANNMLNACENIMNAFINDVEAQKGKKVPGELADEWIETANMIINHLDTTIETQI